MRIENAMLADGRIRDVRIEGERIAAVGEDLAGDEQVIDVEHRRLLPGMIDVHVHFRQPGFGHKETWASGSASAAAGGVTAVVDQPNTEPPTVDGPAYDEKAEFAGDSIVDFGINGGVTADWKPEDLFNRELFALGEVFLADSTGDMGIDEELFVEALAAAAERDVPVTVHAEDASLFNKSAKQRTDPDAWSAYRRDRAEVAAVRNACALGADRDARIHVAHTSTPDAVDIAAEAGATCEVTPHHMFLSRNDLDDLGTHGRMNPPLRRERHRQKIYERVVDGTVDVVATDHAPHTAGEKDATIWEAPSGVPGVETALPLLLNEARSGKMSFERVRDLTAANPAEIFDLAYRGRIEEGNYADLILVDPETVEPIEAERLHTNCEWTPFEGRNGVFPEWTMVRGEVVFRREPDEFADEGYGRNVRADRPPARASNGDGNAGSTTDDRETDSADDTKAGGADDAKTGGADDAKASGADDAEAETTDQ